MDGYLEPWPRGTYSWVSHDEWMYHVYSNDPSISNSVMGMSIDGPAWSGNRIQGTVLGFYADTNAATPTTGIMAGSLLGTYDSTQNTFQSVSTGIWLETTKFLTMAGKNTDLLNQSNLPALSVLNIPAVEIGRATLSGNNGYSSVTISDAIFFAYASGQKPLLWASGSVTGNYDTNSPGPINMTSSAGLSAIFDMKIWDAGTGKWLASIYNGAGTLAGYDIQFRGAAAGQWEDGSFYGTAAGITDSSLSITAAYLGGSSFFPGGSGPLLSTPSWIKDFSVGPGAWSYDADLNYSLSMSPGTQIAGASGGAVYSDFGRTNPTGYWISKFTGIAGSTGTSFSGQSNFAAITRPPSGRTCMGRSW